MNEEPAFPCEWGKVKHTPGMTLRDYFAAKAMQVFIASPQSMVEDDVEQAYRVADAMMAAREE